MWNSAKAISDNERLSHMFRNGRLPLGSWTHKRMHAADPVDVPEASATSGAAHTAAGGVVFVPRESGRVRAGGDSTFLCCTGGLFGGGVRERDLGRAGFRVARPGSCVLDTSRGPPGRRSCWSVSIA